MWHMLETMEICPPEFLIGMLLVLMQGKWKKKIERGHHSLLDGAQIDTAVFPF